MRLTRTFYRDLLPFQIPNELIDPEMYMYQLICIALHPNILDFTLLTAN
jgi:hypothetical protein